MNQFSMPSQPESEVADALLNFVQHGAFPDKEEVISARLSSPILSITLRSLQEACQEATVCLFLGNPKSKRLTGAA